MVQGQAYQGQIPNFVQESLGPILCFPTLCLVIGTSVKMGSGSVKSQWQHLMPLCSINYSNVKLLVSRSEGQHSVPAYFDNIKYFGCEQTKTNLLSTAGNFWGQKLISLRRQYGVIPWTLHPDLSALTKLSLGPLHQKSSSSQQCRFLNWVVVLLHPTFIPKVNTHFSLLSGGSPPALPPPFLSRLCSSKIKSGIFWMCKEHSIIISGFFRKSPPSPVNPLLRAKQGIIIICFWVTETVHQESVSVFQNQL